MIQTLRSVMKYCSSSPVVVPYKEM